MAGERAREKEKAALELEEGRVWRPASGMCHYGRVLFESHTLRKRALSGFDSPSKPRGPTGRPDAQQQHFKTHLTQQLCND